MEVLGVFWAGRSHFWLVPIGDFDIFCAFATRQEMSRNVEKCRVLSKSLLGGGPLAARNLKIRVDKF